LIEPQVEALIRATGIDFRIGGNRAFYAPGPDFVMVPPPQAYFEPINWHRTALHELGLNAEARIMPHGPMLRLNCGPICDCRASTPRRSKRTTSLPRA
jgi:antirestriction protein ArdC